MLHNSISAPALFHSANTFSNLKLSICVYSLGTWNSSDSKAASDAIQSLYEVIESIPGCDGMGNRGALSVQHNFFTENSTENKVLHRRAAGHMVASVPLPAKRAMKTAATCNQ